VNLALPIPLTVEATGAVGCDLQRGLVFASVTAASATAETNAASVTDVVEMVGKLAASATAASVTAASATAECSVVVVDIAAPVGCFAGFLLSHRF
jgi:hypothetical protein